MNKKTKKRLSIVANVAITIFLVFAVAITIYAIIAKSTSEDGIPGSFGNNAIFAIETNSMHGENGFDEGSLIFCKKLTDKQKANLKKGDVITFWSNIDINGNGLMDDLNTHRIVEEPINRGGNIYYVTKGDNNKNTDGELHYSDVVAIWQSENFEGEVLSGKKINGLGNFLIFMTSELGFFLLIVLPLGIFFIFELVNLIRVVGQIRGKKTISAVDEEEIKRKAIEEYLKNQSANNAEQPVASVEEPKE